jgi:carbon monoxide dehydrogenase subunit G
MPRATVSHEVEVDREIGHVWERLQDAATWANIGPVENVWDALHNGDGHLMSYRWSTTVAARVYKGIAETIEVEPPEVMTLRLDAGEVAGTLTARLSEVAADRTTVDVALEIISRGTLSTLFFPLVAEAVRNGLPAQVERFAARVADAG